MDAEIRNLERWALQGDATSITRLASMAMRVREPGDVNIQPMEIMEDLWGPPPSDSNNFFVNAYPTRGPLCKIGDEHPELGRSRLWGSGVQIGTRNKDGGLLVRVLSRDVGGWKLIVQVRCSMLNGKRTVSVCGEEVWSC